MFVNSANDLTLNNVVTMFTVTVRGRLLVPVLDNVFLIRDLSMVKRATCFGCAGGGANTNHHVFGVTPLRRRFRGTNGTNVSTLVRAPVGPLPRSGLAIHF